MLSHEGLPPERETLEYAWQIEVVLGKISGRLTTIQVIRLYLVKNTLLIFIRRWKKLFVFSKIFIYK